MSRPPVETQPERTGLAWQRTALGVLAVAGLIGHGALLDGNPLLLLLAGGVALLGLAVLGAVAPRRYRAVRQAVAQDEAPAGERTAALALAVVVATAVAAGCAVLGYA